MIGSVSNASFASYGMQRPPQGGRSGVSASSDEDLESKNALKGEKKKEQEKLSNPQELDEAEKKQVEDLKKRDAEVRTHEQAHMAAAGNLALGGPNYVFQTGPDGRQYAIGGDVKIDTSPGRTPEESIRKAQQIRAAAHAPAEPSGQDSKVAAAAATMESEATTKAAEKSEKNFDKTNLKSEADSENSRGEITSARQVFSASSSDSDSSGQNGEKQNSPQNRFLAQAAKLYQSQQAYAESAAAR